MYLYELALELGERSADLVERGEAAGMTGLGPSSLLTAEQAAALRAGRPGGVPPLAGPPPPAGTPPWTPPAGGDPGAPPPPPPAPAWNATPAWGQTPGPGVPPPPGAGQGSKSKLPVVLGVLAVVVVVAVAAFFFIGTTDDDESAGPLQGQGYCAASEEIAVFEERLGTALEDMDLEEATRVTTEGRARWREAVDEMAADGDPSIQADVIRYRDDYETLLDGIEQAEDATDVATTLESIDYEGLQASIGRMNLRTIADCAGR